MKIEEMQAGRELDALVAARVMGWRPLPRCTQLHPPDTTEDKHTFAHYPPEYSTDIKAVWEVVEKIQQSGILDHIEQREGEQAKYVVQFCAKGNEAWWHEHAYGDTVPLAICRAALKVMGEK